MTRDTGQEEPALLVREIEAKSILTASKIYPYVINPYVGCQHACSYCYARYMKKFTGHREPWGTFVDVKINAAELLRKEVARKKKATVWMSGVCDPYQPLEEKYRLTRHCLQVLLEAEWPVVVQTRSPLVLRDIDIIGIGKSIEVGFSITTADDDIRKSFEPHAPPIAERVNALAELKRAKVRTYAMIAPILPGAENLMEMLAGKVDYILVDRMNYHYADALYRRLKLEERRSEEYASSVAHKIAADCERLGIGCTIVF
ncbi:radical SAM protein [Geomonas sp. Red276]